MLTDDTMITAALPTPGLTTGRRTRRLALAIALVGALVLAVCTAAEAMCAKETCVPPVGFTNLVLRGHAAHVYSWMSPPRRSRRPIAVWGRGRSGITCGDGWGARSLSARCGRSRL
jgi:hypothetical protein